MAERKKRVLTGVKPTGIPHIGNYLGAIRPALQLMETHDAFLFIADLHALTTRQDPKKLTEETYSVAATWLSLGVDPQRATFYKQSDVPEIATLAWILSCVTPVGLLMRGHSFVEALQNQFGTAEEARKKIKESLAAADQAEIQALDVNHGVLTYPVLMAADILMFDVDVVPVGKDQKQHLEMTQELARKINNEFGECLRVPSPKIDEAVMTVPGLDGRKMSKSYDNAIEIFSTDKHLESKVKQIVTNSTEFGQPLEPETIFGIYKLFAKPEQTEKLLNQYRSGRKDPSIADSALEDPKKNYFGWGHAKTALAELLLEELGPARREYTRLMADKPYIRKLLNDGAEKARAVAREVLGRVMDATGLVR